MSTIITALLIIISSIAIPLIFIFITRNKNNRRNEKFLNLFNKEGSKQDLSFSSQELLKNKIIGLDGLKQTLLVFDFENDDDITSITMVSVKNCVVEKKYDSIVIGRERKPLIEPHLRNINLKFSFKNSADPVSVSFYDSDVNSIYEMPELEAKAKTWEAVLSKMIFKEIKISA